MSSTIDNSLSYEGEEDDEERDFHTSKKRSNPPLIDRVVQVNKKHGVTSAYGDSYEDQEDDWTVLTARDQDHTTLLEEQQRSLLTLLRRHIGASMCFLALLTFVMAMLVCIIWAVPGVYTDTIVIAPNDTVMAAYEVDRQVTDNILYRISSSEPQEVKDGNEELVFYREVCDYIKPSSVEVHISQVFTVSTEVKRMEIGHLYLVTDSSLHYTVNLTFSSPAAQAVQDCSASVHLFNSYNDFSLFLESNDTRNAVSSHQFCSSESTLHFTLDVPQNSYYFLGLYVAVNHGQAVKTAGVQINGTIVYYDASLLNDRIVCRFFPSAHKSSCTVPIGNKTLTNYENLCVLITRGSPYIPGADPGPIAMGNTGYSTGSYYTYEDSDVVHLERTDTTYWGINRVAVFVCLFVPLMMSCCVLTILTPRRTNYGSYVRTNRKKKSVNR